MPALESIGSAKRTIKPQKSGALTTILTVLVRSDFDITGQLLSLGSQTAFLFFKLLHNPQSQEIDRRRLYGTGRVRLLARWTSAGYVHMRQDQRQIRYSVSNSLFRT